MRRTVRIAMVAAMLAAMSALTPVGASAGPATIGTQVRILPGLDVQVEAGEPFFVKHGFDEEYLPMATLHDYGFALYVDGFERHGAREVVVEDGLWVEQRWIFNFPQGLPAGEYTFYGVWTNADGVVLDRSITVSAVD